MAVGLDARLRMIAALTPACDMAADVGADHGFLGVALLQSGKCARVQFLELREKPLSHARRLVEVCGLSERALFGLGDGLEALREPAQAIVVAGMGGGTIAGILERGRERLHGATVVMQPNVEIEALRERLERMNLRIVDERLARAGGRWYVGIAAREGEMRLSPVERLVGPALLRCGGEAFEDYRQFRMRVLTKALAGAEAGDEARAADLRHALAMWKEAGA